MSSAYQRFAAIAAVSALVAAGTVPARGGAAARPAIELRALRDVSLAMELCWRASLPIRVVPGMTVKVMVSFKRDGEMFGEPKFTFVTPRVPIDTVAAYQRAAAAALARCSRLPFSAGLGQSIAGRPFIFQFIDRRNEKRT